MAHIEGVGDTQWVNAGTFLSKEEKGQVEGIAFRVTGESGNKYDVWYQGHVQNVGDTQWFKNGEFCGTREQGLRLEAFVVAVIPR
jgi:uncharacterized protein YjdB